jgi:hypothetical protein
MAFAAILKPFVIAVLGMQGTERQKQGDTSGCVTDHGRLRR